MHGRGGGLGTPPRVRARVLGIGPSAREMNALPDDVARVLEDFCGAKEIVMLGRTSRRFRPNEKTWQRHAKCNPLTEHVMVTWGKTRLA